METIIISIKNETQKLFYKKKTTALLIISAMVTVLASFFALFFQNKLGIVPVNSGSFSVWVLGFFTNLILPLFVFMLAGDLFAGELADKTLKLVFLRPVTRWKTFAAKILTLGIYVAVNLGIVFVISSATSLFLNGNDAWLVNEFKAFAAYGASIIPMIFLGILAAFLAQFFKSSSGVLVVSILAFIAAKVLSMIFPGISAALFTNYTDWHLLFLGGSVPLTKILSVFMFMVSYSIIFLASGFYLFDRREL